MQIVDDITVMLANYPLSMKRVCCYKITMYETIGTGTRAKTLCLIEQTNFICFFKMKREQQQKDSTWVLFGFSRVQQDGRLIISNLGQCSGAEAG